MIFDWFKKRKQQKIDNSVDDVITNLDPTVFRCCYCKRVLPIQDHSIAGRCKSCVGELFSEANQKTMKVHEKYIKRISIDFEKINLKSEWFSMKIFK